MSRFTVGQEITPKSDGAFLTYGKFYRIVGWSHGNAVVVDNCGHRHEMPDDFGLTREEYEQAEREKDPFAPGKWVVCVKDDFPAEVGDIIQVLEVSDVLGCFRVRDMTAARGCEACLKSHFRPATPKEIKEQEMKIMDEENDDNEKIEIAHVFQIDPDIFTAGWRERMAESERQTFTVGGQEFYVGQTVWTTMKLGIGDKGTALVVVGCDLANKTAIIVKEPDTVKAFSITADGRITTTDPKLHKWKFGDWARHPEWGVVLVGSEVDDDGDVVIYTKDGFYSHLNPNVSPKILTYISTAEIPE